MKKFVKKHLPTIIVIVTLLFGFALLFYPDVSTWYNSRIHAGLNDAYARDVAALRQEQIDNHFRRAEAHNAVLAQLDENQPLIIGDGARNQGILPSDYADILEVRGQMGRIVIPKINVNLPIFHYTTDAVLHRGAGHLEGTAFPIGGYGNHSAITAHSGLPNARMFTNMLNRNLWIGDQFFVYILDRQLAFEVIEVAEVLPHYVERLRVRPGEDLMTLITCTPYAVNTYRLLVTGRRIPYDQAMAAAITAEYTSINVDTRVYIFIAFFLLFMLVFSVYQFIVGRRGYVKPVRPASVPSTSPAAAQPTAAKTMAASSLQSDPYITIVEQDLPKKVTPAPEGKSGIFGMLAGGRADAKNKKKTIETPGPRYGNRSKPNPGAKPRKSAISTLTDSKRNIAAACIAALLLIVGIGVLASRTSSNPVGQDAVADFMVRMDDYRAIHTERMVAELMERWQEDGEFAVNGMGYLEEDPFTVLNHQITEHNRQIYESGQQSLPDPFAYSQTNFSLSHFGFEEDMIGFISIPTVDIELPIYMGASQENLHRGLAHLTHTSLPVGGANTNAVIAGHMDLGRTAILRDIENLETGDSIYITNFYQTITYTIIDIRLIYPSQTEDLTIQNGRDLITLLAYRPGNSQRYMVIAERTH